MVVLMCIVLHGSFCKRRRWWCIASKSNEKLNINSKITRKVGIPWLDHVPINVVWGSWRTPKFLDRFNYESQGENNIRIRN
jgi:hypothetical protein